MSVAAATTAPANPPPGVAPRRRGGRLGIVVTLVVALVASAVLQQFAYSYRTAAIKRGLAPATTGPSEPADLARRRRVANLDSFSLALLLGGLRGPLVMFLWTSSESQKSDRDLESFDTKVEMIRLLQPEFDSVHLFQIWNLAYNVSVQYASNANKYGAILDAIEYGRRAEETSPDNINLVSAIGGVYTDKLGGSTEKAYYIGRVRTETLPLYRVTFPVARAAAFKRAVADAGLDEGRIHLTGGDAATGGTVTALLEKISGDRVLAAFTGPGVTVTSVARQTLRPANPTGRRYDMDTMLDAAGNLLPELVKPTRAVSPGAMGNDGSELQYLKQFQPFPYGISPLALGYDYLKRAQVLQVVGKQKHAQMSEYSIHGRPATTLRAWAEEEWERGRRLEQRGLGLAPSGERSQRELQTASYAPDAKVVDRPSIDEGIFSYERSAQVAAAAQAESAMHVAVYPSRIQTAASNADYLNGLEHLDRADALYLRAIVAGRDAAARGGFLAKAKAEYAEASRFYYILSLKYYVDDADAAFLKYARADVPKLSLDEMRALYARAWRELAAKHRGAENIPSYVDLVEYGDNIKRIETRLAKIK